MNDWEKSVQALWAFTYVSAGFRGAVPRLVHLDAALDELTRVIQGEHLPGLDGVLETELRNLISRFREVAGPLNQSLERMSGLLAELEKRS